MFSGSTQGVRRFSLLLLEEGELYVEDFVASARWPAGVAGNWQRLPHMKGQLRLCTKSLFWEPDDVRVPIVRCGGVSAWVVCLHPCCCAHCIVLRGSAAQSARMEGQLCLF